MTFTTLEGDRLHSVHSIVTKDPATGRPAVLVHQTDETARARAEERADEQRILAERLQETLAVVEQQKRDILALSAPVLEVGDDTIALPLIGVIDDERAQALTETLLMTLRDRGASLVILDLTSAVVEGQGGATRLMQMLRAVRLLGARAVITGVQPALATHLVEVGFSDADVSIARSLARGLAQHRRPQT